MYKTNNINSSYFCERYRGLFTMKNYLREFSHIMYMYISMIRTIASHPSPRYISHDLKFNVRFTCAEQHVDFQLYNCCVSNG